LTARGAATRSHFVEAAADLIYAHGVERTSLDDVMAASGVRYGTIQLGILIGRASATRPSRCVNLAHLGMILEQLASRS